MKYKDGEDIQYGDIIIIGLDKNKYISVEDDGTTINPKEYINNGINQKILVCGNNKFNKTFYLTFKYNKGFINYDGETFKSGVPWTERTIFDIELLKKAINSDNIFIIKEKE